MNISEYLEECYHSGSDVALLLREKSALILAFVEGKVEKINSETRQFQVNGQPIELDEVIGFPEPSF
ncbi:hypothetical protein [Desulfitobacterium metallireducens]|uniref:Uncharacterized protein n=1 Tax=Desulfitobacterium metallireducens DSM 15288 TaxID=871968 RepID=W0ED88_9FIRM|nr:hypothetical protein [Desulfitobacterium metallireducens]AHF08707.1 hypothetical protein DESME_15080 [Desulfitobacterium metallireducens DSM 15288]